MACLRKYAREPLWLLHRSCQTYSVQHHGGVSIRPLPPECKPDDSNDPWTVFSLTPYLLQKYRQVHRINGRIIFSLWFVAIVGALMISRHSFGGSLSTQLFNWTLAPMASYAITKSWMAIRRRDIVEHRNWALRAMFWLGSIVASRPLMTIAIFTADLLDSNYTVSNPNIIISQLSSLHESLFHFRSSDATNSNSPWQCTTQQTASPPHILFVKMRYLQLSYQCWLVIDSRRSWEAL